jgi:hypothetical protein
MNRKIGEIITIDDDKLLVKESSHACDGCVFYNTLCKDNKVNIPEKFLGSCSHTEREDGKDIIFVRIDSVNHPSHYTWLKDLCGIEAIDITRWLPADISNAVKYLLRQGHKHEEGMSNNQKAIEDCKKAIWYINDYINNILKKHIKNLLMI